MTAEQAPADWSPSLKSGGAIASVARWAYGERPWSSLNVGSAFEASATSNVFTPDPVVNVPTGLWLAKMPSPATTWKWYSVPARTSMRATNDGWPPTSSDTIDEALSISAGVPSDCQKLTSDGTEPATRYATKATFPALASTDRTVISGPRSTWRIGGGLSKTAGTPSGQPSGGGVTSQTVRNGTRSTSAMSTGVTIGGSPIVPGSVGGSSPASSPSGRPAPLGTGVGEAPGLGVDSGPPPSSGTSGLIGTGGTPPGGKAHAATILSLPLNPNANVSNASAGHQPPLYEPRPSGSMM